MEYSYLLTYILRYTKRHTDIETEEAGVSSTTTIIFKFVEDQPFVKQYLSVFSARQHICYSALYAIARPSVRPSGRPSVCLSVRHTGGSVKDGSR